MKNNILVSLIFLLACTCSMTVHAQLEVLANGNVTASKNLTIDKNLSIGTTINSRANINIEQTAPSGTSSYYGLKSLIKTSSSMPTSPMYGIYSMVTTANSSYTSTAYPLIGVFGYAYKKPSITTFAAGVAGIAHAVNGGIGVYGGIRYGNDVPTSMSASGKYAGYFDGSVYLNGTTMTPAIAILSGDSIIADVPRNLSGSFSNEIKALQPISYTLKQDSAWLYDEDAKELQGVHYGLNLQDVQKVFPELVYERGENKYINYIELIPILIKSIQELSAEVEELKNQLKSDNNKF